MPERIILKGNSALLKPLITEILAFHQILRDKDIGEFVGQTINEHVRAAPQALKLKVLFYSVQSPPWKAVNLVKATYNVPFINRSKMDWSTIKAACGGANGYEWGRFRTTANITDSSGNIRQMQVYGASESEAEQRFRALLTLSEGTIVTLSTAEEKKIGKRATDKQLYKESTRVYPAYATIIHSEKIITESHNATLNGNYYRSRGRVPLWTVTEPPDATETFREALRVRGSIAAASP